MGKSGEFLSSYLGKVLLKGKFSLKKGKNNLPHSGEPAPHIWGKGSQEKKFPFPFLSVYKQRRQALLCTGTVFVCH